VCLRRCKDFNRFWGRPLQESLRECWCCTVAHTFRGFGFWALQWTYWNTQQKIKITISRATSAGRLTFLSSKFRWNSSARSFRFGLWLATSVAQLFDPEVPLFLHFLEKRSPKECFASQRFAILKFFSVNRRFYDAPRYFYFNSHFATFKLSSSSCLPDCLVFLFILIHKMT
jgi:hypothetical protein